MKRIAVDALMIVFKAPPRRAASGTCFAGYPDLEK
jgi:hypothetical protein